MSGGDKFFAIMWLCIVALFTATIGWFWQACLALAIAAVAFAPNKGDSDE